MPKGYIEILTKLLLQSYNRMTMTSMKMMKIFSCSKKYDLYKMAEIEKEAVGFPPWCHLVAWEFT